MCEIVVNDLMEELVEENKRLLSELKSNENCFRLLENYRNFSLNLSNNCKCNPIINNKYLIKLMEIKYKSLKESIEGLVHKKEIIKEHNYAVKTHIKGEDIDKHIDEDIDKDIDEDIDGDIDEDITEGIDSQTVTQSDPSIAMNSNRCILNVVSVGAADKSSVDITRFKGQTLLKGNKLLMKVKRSKTLMKADKFLFDSSVHFRCGYKNCRKWFRSAEAMNCHKSSHLFKKIAPIVVEPNHSYNRTDSEMSLDSNEFQYDHKFSRGGRLQHNLNERERRVRLNGCFDVLLGQLPHLKSQERRATNVKILSDAILEVDNLTDTQKQLNIQLNQLLKRRDQLLKTFESIDKKQINYSF